MGRVRCEHHGLQPLQLLSPALHAALSSGSDLGRVHIIDVRETLEGEVYLQAFIDEDFASEHGLDPAEHRILLSRDFESEDAVKDSMLAGLAASCARCWDDFIARRAGPVPAAPA